MSKKGQGRKSTARAAAKHSPKRTRSSSTQGRRPRRKALAALVLIIASIAATGIVAAQGGLGALVAAPSSLLRLGALARSSSGAPTRATGRATAKGTAPQQSPTPPLTKEYIYAAGKAFAVDEGVGGPAPLITSIQPSSGTQGQTQPLSVIVTGSHLAGAAVSFDVPGLSGVVSQTPAPTDNSFTATVTIAATAPSGQHNMIVTTPNGTGSAVFTVNPAPGSPNIISISPSVARPGDTLSPFTVSGSGLSGATAIVFSNSSGPVSGFTITQFTVQSDNVVTANVAIDPSVPAQPYTVYVTGSTGTSNSQGFTVQAANPTGQVQTPTVTSIDTGSGSKILINTAFTLKVFGANFISTTQVFIGTIVQSQGQVVNSGEIDVALPGFSFAEVQGVHVETPVSGHLPATSNSVTLEIDNPFPSITGISPAVVGAGTAGFSLTVNGSKFVNGNGQSTVVRVNGVTRSTIDGATSQITATILASDIATPGNLSISVLTVGPGGGTTGSIALSVVPLPVITGITPVLVAGTGNQSITVSGSNFTPSDKVQVNGGIRSTSVGGPGSLTATVLGSDITQGGTLNVTVGDPNVFQGASAVFPFTVNNPLPSITGISPQNIVAGTSPVPQLILTGTGFVPVSVGRVNGNARATSLNGSGNLVVTLTAADIASPTTLAITVFNGAPGGGTSSPANYSILPPPPAAPANLTATAISSSQINLAWTDNSNNETAFIIQRKAGASGTYSTIAIVASNVTTYLDLGPATGTTYFYKVQATNNGSNSAFSNEFSATAYPAPPSGLTGLSATAMSTSQINLSWTDPNTTETGIKLERALASNGPFSQVAVLCPSIQSYQDTGLASGTPYYYRLRPSNSAGDGPYTGVQGATTQSAIPPAAPSSLTANAQPGLQVFLTWFNNSTTQTAVLIERMNGNNPFTQIAQVGATTNSYTDTGGAAGLQPNSQYCYRVRATDGTLFSAYSNTPCTTTGSSMIEIPSPVPGALPGTLPGTLPGIARFQRALYAQLVPFARELVAWNLQPGTTSLELVNNGAGYSIVETGMPLQSSPPANPAGLVAWPASGTQINLSWVAGDNAQTSFNLQRATASGGPYSTIASIQCAATVTYQDTGLTAGATYYYKIQASNGLNSGFSNIASGKTPVTPTIINISPSYVLVGTATPFTLTVNGSNFVNGANPSVVNVGGTPRTTTFVNSSQLTAALTPDDLGTVATLAVTVVNSNPTQTSNSVNLNVVANNTPTVTPPLSPASALAGNGGVTLTVNGTGFVSASTVQVGGSPRTTTFNGPTQLVASLPASDLATAVTLSITVANPAPGTSSTTTSFAVNNPVPVITPPISPSSVVVGGAGFNLMVQGSGFVNASVVKVNNNSRTTTLSNGMLTAAILASDISSVGTLSITVFNPTPGGGTSNTVTLTVNPATPPAPTALTATASSTTEVDLSWSYSGIAITGFKIFQNTGNGYGPTPLATVGAGVTTYSDLSVNPGNRYCYKVQAYNSAGASPFSGESCATTPQF